MRRLFMYIAFLMIIPATAFSQWRLVSDEPCPNSYIFSMAILPSTGDVLAVFYKFESIEVWLWDVDENEWETVADFSLHDLEIKLWGEYYHYFYYLSGVLTPAFAGRNPLLILGLHQDNEDGPIQMVTYEYLKSSWKDIVPPFPANRADLLSAVDKDGNIVLHGGWSGGSNGYPPYYYHKDTWMFNGHWSKLSTDGPPHRNDAVFAYDKVKDRFVLVSGLKKVKSRVGYKNETWEFSENKWRQLISDTIPPAHFRAYLFYRESTNQLLLYSSCVFKRHREVDSKLYLINQLWELEDSDWRKLVSVEGINWGILTMIYDGRNDSLLTIHNRKLYELRLRKLLPLEKGGLR